MIQKVKYCQETPDLFKTLMSSSCLFEIINENLINDSGLIELINIRNLL